MFRMGYLYLILFFVSTVNAGLERQAHNIDFDWKFICKDISSASKLDFDDSDWRILDLPHDWSVENGYSPENTPQNGWLAGGIGWYRKTIDVPEQWLKGKILLCFDGVFMNSQVFINGNAIGGRPYGFMSFSCDLTEYLKAGVNVIAVRVDNTPVPTSRFYHGSGIYGHVELLIMPKTHIVPNGGIFARTIRADSSEALLAIDTEVLNNQDIPVSINICQKLRNIADEVIAQSNPEKIVIKPGQTGIAQQELHVEHPVLWSTQSPYLYSLETIVKEDDVQIDKVQTSVGIRTIRFDADTGFWLNDKNIKLKGVCEHLELMPVGLAVPDALIEWRLKQLKSMGCNAIRTAHNPFTPAFYKICDQLGILVMDEIFDGWHRKGANDYGGRFFDQWWKQDVKDWVRRDRNHPCIVIYSIGNETGHKDTNDITGEIRKYDTTRPSTGGTVFYGVDVSGFNGPGGMPGVLEKFHKDNPDQPVVLTEVPHTIQTRGFYRVRNWWRDKGGKRHDYEPYADEQIFFDGHPRYKSSYDNAGVRINARTSWKRTRDLPWISGEFRWTGFDCFGEAHFMGAEFPKRIYNSGVIDLAGFPKDHYYFYQSQWTKEPMVHLLPHWTHPHLKVGTEIPVVAYSNCDEVELFLNDKSLGKQKPGELLDFVWHVPWQAGILRANAYIKGILKASTIVKTADQPVDIKVEVSNNNLNANRRDVSLITLSAIDSEGIMVPWCNSRVDCRIDGPVKLLGFENGDPMDGTNNGEHWRKLFYGMARGYFQSNGQTGPIEITVAAILGDELFQDKTLVAVDVERAMLRGQKKNCKMMIYYTIDGSEPDMSSMIYTKPFAIDKSTVVKVLVVKDGDSWLNLQAEFKKGPEPYITDPRWETANKPDKFNGPFDTEILGKWQENAQIFIFKKDGLLYRVNSNKQSPVAYWWYDFPNDTFENPDFAGAGQLRWINSGQVSKLTLISQKADILEISTGSNIRRFKK
ncbi:MAG: DUF4982 domain-containing protein [Phycisphaerae bacterium]|nr:DUF4982 domain-containing protein [Phycisphaerae bacterium]